METSFNNLIIDKYIKPEYENEIKDLLSSKKIWNKLSSIFHTLSTILISISSLLAFSTASFNNKYLNYFAGTIGLLSIASKEFGNYSKKKATSNTLKLNKFLKNLNLPEIGDVTDVNLILKNNNSDSNEFA
jgi:hypothetical protein